MKLLFCMLTLVVVNTNTSSSDVYICISKTASKYHLSESCKGLSRCTHQVKKTSKDEAKRLGYTLCGWE